MNLNSLQLSMLRQRLGSSLTLGVVLFSVCYGTSCQAAGPSATPSPMSSVSPVTSPTALPTFTAAEGRRLLAEFRKAQSSEMAALKHRNKTELKELRTSQDARRKEWKENENNKRHQLFQTEAKKAPERRAYFADRNARWDAFNKILADELTQRRNEQDVRVKALEEQQKANLREFQNYLDRGERPPAGLWPGGR